jgi:uncharacterized protein YndB with AHSA1/START domain
MSNRYVTHDTMLLERTYPASPARVFAAWSDAKAKTVWFLGSEPDEFTPSDYELDFRVGGREFTRGGPEGGDVYTYDARYDDIVADSRIVYSYFMLRNDVRISSSVTSIEFVPDGNQTKLVLTEHGIYLDGEDKPEFRTEGIGGQLDALGRWLAQS